MPDADKAKAAMAMRGDFSMHGRMPRARETGKESA